MIRIPAEASSRLVLSVLTHLVADRLAPALLSGGPSPLPFATAVQEMVHLLEDQSPRAACIGTMEHDE